MSRGRFKPFGVVVTAEHASNRLPAHCGTLGLEPDQLESHIAWDPGSRGLARALGRAFGTRAIEGRWSRLWIDLNRSLTNRRVIPEVAFDVPAPGNARLPPAERERRVREVYRPFREATAAAIGEAISRKGRCLHWSVHTFTPELDGATRNADVGLLYDPRRAWERGLAARIARELGTEGFRVRLNYPYRGTADGHTTAMRRLHADSRYAGIELEVNQALLPDWSSTVERVVAAAVRASV